MRPSSRPARWSRPGRTACSTARRFSTMTAMAAATSGSRQRSPRRAATSRSICRDSDPQSTSFVNSSHANMQAAVAMAFAYLIDAEIPKNTGALRPLKVIAKQGTIVWADPGRPVTLCTSHPSNEIVEAIVKALSASCPERAMAGWSRRFRIAIQGEDPRTGKNFIWHLFQARPGGGASSGGDGWSSIGEWHSVGGLKFGSLEVAEVRFPLHFRPMNSAQAPAATASIAAASASSLDLVLETEKPAQAATPRATARATVPAACSAARTACRIIIACCPKAARRACCAPRKSASNCVPAIASRSAPPAAAAGDRRAKRSAEARAARPRAGPDGRCAGGAGVLMMFTIGVDVGGTYTDLVAIDETGRTVFAKSPSTPADQSIGVMAGLEELARRLNVTRAEMLGATDRWCTAPRLRPTRCWSARAQRSRCSPPKAIATSSRCARGSSTTATICVRRRRSRWCRANGVLASGNGSRPMARSLIPLDDEIARRGHRRDPAIRRDLGRGVLPALLSQSRARTRRRRTAGARTARASASRAPATCCRRSRNMSGSRPRS